MYNINTILRNSGNADNKSYLISDDSTVEGSHIMEQDGPIINDDALQKNCINVNNNVIA